MNTLPDGWVKTTMGDVCRVVGGSTPDTNVSDYWGGDIPWLTPEDLARDHSQYVSEGRRNITEQGYVSCSTQLVPAGTILFTSRAPIGYVAIARQPVCTNQGFKSFVLPAGISSKYLYWYLRWATPLIRKMGSGTTFAEIFGQGGKDSSVAASARTGARADRFRYRGTALPRVDVSESLVRRARHNSILMRAAVLTDALRGDWPSKRLGDVAEVFVGTTPARSNAALWNGGVPWVSSGEVAFCRIKRTHETRKKMSDDFAWLLVFYEASQVVAAAGFEVASHFQDFHRVFVVGKPFFQIYDCFFQVFW